MSASRSIVGGRPRARGERKTAPRGVVANGRLAPLQAASSSWRFPAPFGEQAMVEVPLSEIITRVLDGRVRRTGAGVAADFLAALSPMHLDVRRATMT